MHQGIYVFAPIWDSNVLEFEKARDHLVEYPVEFNFSQVKHHKRSK